MVDTGAILEARRRMYAMKDRRKLADLAALFAVDFERWMDLTAWTYVVKEVDDDGNDRPASRRNQPFVMWPCQRAASRELLDCIAAGVDVLFDKSREMGASWLVVFVAVWGWLFKGWDTLFVSRVEDLVDKAGDPDSLLWKAEYAIASQPTWLLPAPPHTFERDGGNRAHLMIRNPAGGTITGAACTGNVGRGGRRTFVCADELAAWQHSDAESAWRTLSDTTACKVAIATPAGAQTKYSQLYFQGRSTGNPRVIRLLYHEHPHKARRGEWRTDHDGAITGEPGSRYWWSPWFAKQLAKRDLLDLRQNVLAAHVGSAALFFAPRLVAMQAAWVETPRRCEVHGAGGKLVDSPAGRWRVWRLDNPGSCYALGIDPSYGTGNAFSSITVVDVDRMEVVGEFVDKFLAPHDLAAEAVRACRRVWKGRRRPLINWEVNGPGASLRHSFAQLGWSRLWRRRRVDGVHDDGLEQLGWLSGSMAKRQLLGDLARVMGEGELRVRSQETLDELRTYQVLEDGSIGPAVHAGLTQQVREGHGDRVISLAVAVRAAPDALGPAEPRDDDGLPDHTAWTVLDMEEALR